MQTTHISNPSTEHAEWLSELGFHKDELAFFKKQLTEVAGKNTAVQIMKLVEHFENQFLVRTENIDILHHDINEHLGKIAEGLQEKTNLLLREEASLHKVLKERFNTESKLFAELKVEFNTFLSKVLYVNLTFPQ